ncbi:MAG: bifunctional diaminohydroxyphosphoribosylaminopyrimidine deaminase/5-amino-6-(5-phosphoribosylamino)uracil reductase RibD [Flavobacterium sp.]|nr:MAG: bifunctional diaminohydroxyphosphoribosylaminopyrimidine deaminase/5-amino-6-(5-phosphoribosylamino)uracil reductase RibD [Flavobacterium sp.]
MRHELYMNRCIELAKNGLGTTYPNPLVGSVIVCKDTIIGEGWHKKAGEAHAEVNAINSVKNPELLKESTIYVSLEPCSHFGKTPPCSDLIIASGIPNVVIGTADPNEKVAGKGIEKLRAAGINVTVGVLQDECRELNKRFFTFHNKKRPYIILKWAESADGYLSPKTKDEQKPVWITNQYSRQLVHKWRSEEAAILVGTQTVVDDNPMLNVRDWTTSNQPIRIVIDKSNRISRDSHIFDSQQKTIVISEKIVCNDKENVIFEVVDFSADILPQLMKVLHKNDIQSVIVEGGQKTLQGFIDADLWDEARVFKGNVSPQDGTQAPKLGKSCAYRELVSDDELLTFSNHD